MLKKIRFFIKRDGILGFIKYAIGRLHLKKNLIRLLLSPITIPIAVGILAILPWIRIRLIMLFSNRVGHYAWNTEFWLSTLDVYEDEGNKKVKTLFYTVPGYAVSNEQLHRMWKRAITILPFPYVVAEVDRYLQFWSSKYRNDLIKNFFRPQGYDVWNLTGKSNKPHIDFTSEEERQGKELLQALGIPEKANFICLLGRDPSYLNQHMPNQDLSYTNYRDVDINNFKQATEFLANSGYYVIRMGKHVKDPLIVNHPKIIDYANSKFRSDFSDIYLSAHCFIFISVGTGLDTVAYIFKRPILIVNHPVIDSWYHPGMDLLITKKVFDIKNKKYLTQIELAEAFPYKKTDRGRLITKIAKDKELCFVENTPEEILEAVKELLGRVLGNWQTTEEDECLQDKYWKNYRDPGLTTLSASPPPLKMPALKVPVFEGENLAINKKIGGVRLRIGSAFLRSNSSWLIGTAQSLKDS